MPYCCISSLNSCKDNLRMFFFSCLRAKEENSCKSLEAYLKHHGAYFENYGALVPIRYKHSDIVEMTDTFKEKLAIGDVFKGRLLDGCMVAVKVFKGETKRTVFVNELASMSRILHVNVVALLGFCVEDGKEALIYEFISYGSLETHYSHLGWEALEKIAVGIARGLQYLHTDCSVSIMHQNISPRHILLEEDFTAKISHFRDALVSVDNRINTWKSVNGSPDSITSEEQERNEYAPPEMRYSGEITHKVDVFSYGMTLLKMVQGRKQNDHGNLVLFPEEIYQCLLTHAELHLYGVTNVEDEDIARKIILVGLWCVQKDPSHRPPMSEVVEMLTRSLEAVAIPPKPWEYSYGYYWQVSENWVPPITDSPATLSSLQLESPR